MKKHHKKVVEPAEPPSIKDNLKIKASKSTKTASKKAKKTVIPAKVATKQPPAKKEPRFEYNPMRSSGKTAGGTDPQDGVFDRTDLKDEWDSQNTIGDPFDTYSNDVLSDKSIDNFLSSDSIQSFNQI